MKRAVAISVGVGAILVVWTALLYTGADEPPKQTPSTPAPAEEIAAAPTLEHAPTAPKAVPAAPSPEPATVGVPSTEGTTADQPSHVQARPEKMGPVEELKAAYESDTRDPEAGKTEAQIRGHFKHEGIPERLLRNVSCVKSACKIELNWTGGDKQAYMIVMMNLVSHISRKIAAEPVGNGSEAVHPIDVYLSRTEPPYVPEGLED